jgi:FkbM family methyltransferase
MRNHDAQMPTTDWSAAVTTPTDFELALLRSLTARLPRIRGAGTVGNTFARFYQRKRRNRIVADVLGFEMMLDPHELVDSALIFAPQLYDHAEIGCLERELSSGDVFVDIGANVGFYSLIASRIVGPSGRVVAIEAEPDTYDALRRNIAMNRCSHVTAVNLGVSDKEAVLTMQVAADDGLHRNRGGNTFLAEGDTSIRLPDPTGKTSKEIQCVPLASILEQHRIDRIDGLKIDAEGFEHRILTAFLAGNPDDRLMPRVIILEQHPDIARTEGDSVSLLEQHGYRRHLRTRQDNFVMMRP